MASLFVVAALAGLAAASPAAQAFDLGVIGAAPTPTVTAAPLASVLDTISYRSTDASVLGSSVANAVGTAAAKVKRDDGGCWGYGGWGPKPSKSPLSSPSPSLYPTPSKSTLQSSGTATTSSSTACPTVPEAGTYCGFINPEDPCAPQPDGYGPKVSPDTIEAFEAYPQFHYLAQSAKTPYGYAQTFVDLNASVSANSYLGLHTLATYSAQDCSAWCDNTTLCTAFNLYIERDPSLNPSPNCTLPSSITNFKCTLWGSGVEPAAANNFGGYRGDFHVVIAGSNGYEKTNNTLPAVPPGCGAPTKCPKGAVNDPKHCMGTKFFPGPFDVNVCSAYAQGQNDYNMKHGSYNSGNSKCKSFNAYMVKKDGVAQGTYCALYDQVYDSNSCSYQPGWMNQHYWGIESSCTYTVGEGKDNSGGDDNEGSDSQKSDKSSGDSSDSKSGYSGGD